MTDSIVDLRIYMRTFEAASDVPGWQSIIDAARGFGIVDARVIEGLLGVGSHGMVKPSNWVMRRQIPVIVALRASLSSMNAFLANGLARSLASGVASLQNFDELDRAAIEAGLPNLSAHHGTMLRLVVGDRESYDGTVLYEAAVHVIRGLGIAGATVFRHDIPDAEGEVPLVIEVVDLPDAITELTRCLCDLVDPSRIESKPVALIRWNTKPAN